MKLEIEISEDEIRDAVLKKVKSAITDKTNQWSANEYIKECVKNQWNLAVISLIEEELKNSSYLRTKIVEEIEKRLKRQITTLLKTQDSL